jgi:SAM-dependent methyltransferase
MGPADFPAGFFERAETERRGAARLDEAAVAAVRDLYSDLEIDGRVLDLCSASASHFDVPPDELLALGGDPDEALPYADAEFDDVLCSNGVGAFTKPLETFAEVARVLRPGGRFVCTFASVYAPAAIRGWVATDDAGRVRIVRTYFARTEAFGPAESDLRTSLAGTGDRLWAVWATRSPGAL